MKKSVWFWVVLVLVMFTCLFLISVLDVGASDGIVGSKGVAFEYFEVDGATCVLAIKEQSIALDCFCPCLSDCEESESQPTLTPTDKPKDKPTPTNPPPPTKTQPPPPTKTEKPDKVKCNSGRGNGPEGQPDCDPGKSYKNKGGD